MKLWKLLFSCRPQPAEPISEELALITEESSRARAELKRALDDIGHGYRNDIHRARVLDARRK